MIYIFQGVQQICSLPSLLCKAIGDLCAQINCKPIQECCETAGKQCAHFMERPLSTYVVLSSVLGFFAIASDGEWHVKLFSLIYIVFAFYFQHKVWQQILASQDERPFIDEAMESQATRESAWGASVSSKLQVPQETVQDAFKKVFMEDFGVLGFFIVLVLFFFWSFSTADPWGIFFSRCCGCLLVSLVLLQVLCRHRAHREGRGHERRRFRQGTNQRDESALRG